MTSVPFSQGTLTDLVAAAHYYGGSHGREYVPKKRVLEFCQKWASRNVRSTPTNTEVADVIETLRAKKPKQFTVTRGPYGGGRLRKFPETGLNRILHDDWLRAIRKRGTPWCDLSTFFPTFSGRKPLGSYSCPDRLARIRDSQECYELKSWIPANSELKRKASLGPVLIQELTEYALDCDSLNIGLEVPAEYFDAPGMKEMQLIRGEVDRQAKLYELLGIGFWLVAIKDDGDLHLVDALRPDPKRFKAAFPLSGHADRKDRLFYEHWRPEWIEKVLKSMVSHEVISEDSRRTYRSYVSTFLGWCDRTLKQREKIGSDIVQAHLIKLQELKERWAEDGAPNQSYVSGVSGVINHALELISS